MTEERLVEMYLSEGRGLTFEDYCIFVCKIGHLNYTKYYTAHCKDSDIIDGTAVWEALRNTEVPFQKAVSL